jgi:hypothetical protein
MRTMHGQPGVGRHIAASLQCLPNQLVIRQTRRDIIENWPPSSVSAPDHVAAAALLALEHQCSLALQRFISERLSPVLWPTSLA